MIDYPRAFFFDNGIRFACQRCGSCCCGAPGTVYLARHEVAAVARYLAMEVERFTARFLFPFRDSYSVREHSDGRCLFYDKGCLIYPVRPFQCRSYPFWLEFLRSAENWAAAAAECPGIGQGKRFSRDEILDWLNPDAG